MIIGDINKLEVKQKTEGGYVCQGNDEKDIFLPESLAMEETKVGQKFDGFVFTQGDELYASAKKPLITLNNFANLVLKSKNPLVAKFDIGLGDYMLTVPLREQVQGMIEGDTYLVTYYYDEPSDKYYGSCRIETFLRDSDPEEFSPGQAVKLQAFKFTDLGIKVIVDDVCEGLLYDNEVFQDVAFGESLKGYVKKMRADNKLDVTLQPFGYKKVLDNVDLILQKLKEGDGVLHLGDKSDPESIAMILSMSKKTFKKTIGALYKKGLIKIEPKSITLVRSS